MTDESVSRPTSPSEPPQWKPLSSIDRRVLGVLVEKAKTTPDVYPMSLNAVCAGCNQKSNRDPVMQLEPEDVEQSLDRLRECGAVAIVQGLGRVSKYRHYAYQWLGVDKVELAVMTELLLRGAQTEGELRARAARMEPIPGLPELRPVLASLKAKGMVIALTLEGRGHVVTHALYLPQELEKLRSQYEGRRVAASTSAVEEPAAYAEARAGRVAQSEPTGAMQAELVGLRAEIAEIRREMEELVEAQRRSERDLADLKSSLGG